jgi:hypothetical protein
MLIFTATIGLVCCADEARRGAGGMIRDAALFVADAAGQLGDAGMASAQLGQVVSVPCDREYTRTITYADGVEVLVGVFAEASVAGLDPSTLKNVHVLLCDREEWNGSQWVPDVPPMPSCPSDAVSCTGRTRAATEYRCIALEEGEDLELDPGQIRVSCGNRGNSRDGTAYGHRVRTVYVAME